MKKLKGNTLDITQLFRWTRAVTSMQELMIKSGKSGKDITETLISLEDKLFIIWDNKRQVESIKLLQGWEQQLRSEPFKPLDNLDYWTKY